MHKNQKSKHNAKSKIEGANGFEEWGGYMEAKKSKLEEQFRLESSIENTLKNNIFNGISIFVNGYTVPSANELKLLMMEYGGMYHHYYTNNKTTYMVASNLPACKIKQLKNVKVIKPDWVMDSISAGKMLDYRLYLLYVDKCSDHFRNNFVTVLSDNKGTSDVKDDSINKVTEEVEIKSSCIINEQKNFKCLPKTASDDNFLNEFYNNSRLHHISTMSTTFKDYVNSLRSKANNTFQGRDNFKRWKSHHGMYNEEMDLIDQHIIMHIDMDCFFVSVGIRNKPQLKGKPIAVTHAKGNKVSKRDGMNRKLEFDLYSEHCKDKLKYKSHEVCHNSDEEETPKASWFEGINEQDSMAEVACCSYEARKCGIRNGMLLGQALKLCPNLNTIPYDFDGYKEVSYALFNIISSFTLDIEAVSCDEMFVDCTEILKYAEATPMQFATFLRTEIKEKTGCPCSVGFGSNVLLARLATKKAKPNGQFYIESGNVKSFIEEFKVSDLPGVGHSTASKLSLMGIITCKDLQNASLNSLQLEFGNKLGLTLFKHASGIDDRPLQFDYQRKSVSADVNYGIRFQNEMECEQFLKKLSEEVGNRLKNIGLKGKCITLKLMTKAKNAPAESAKFMGHGVCDYFTKSVSLPMSTSDPSVILREVLKIIHNTCTDVKDMRGIGIQVTKLDKKPELLEKCMRIDKFLKTDDEVEGKRKELNAVKREVEHSDIINQTSKAEHSDIINQTSKVEHSDIINQTSKAEHSDIINHTSKKGIDFYFKNERNIDVKKDKSKYVQSFLDALPEDIREEILRSTGIQVTKLDKKPELLEKCICMDKFSKPDDEVKGKRKELNAVKSKVEHSNIINQTSKKGIDFYFKNDVSIDAKKNKSKHVQSFLDALPEDIREEILNTNSRYGNTNNLNDSTTHTSFPAASKELSGVNKNIYGKNSWDSNNVSIDNNKNNIGRKNVNSECKLKFNAVENIDDNSSSSSYFEEINGMSLSQVDHDILKALPIDIKSELELDIQNYSKTVSVTHNNEEPDSGKSSCSPEYIIIEGNVARLKSTIPLAEIKSVIQDWIASIQTPEACDIHILTDYLQCKIYKRNLEPVDVVLQFMYRLINRRNSVEWKQMYNDVINNIQKTMQFVYGKHLRTNGKF